MSSFFWYRMIDRFFGENFDYCALKYQRKGIKVNKKKSVSGGLSLYVILLHFMRNSSHHSVIARSKKGY